MGGGTEDRCKADRTVQSCGCARALVGPTENIGISCCRGAKPILVGGKRRVVAKVEWHPGELYPRVGFIVTNLSRPAERVVAFYNHRGTAEQYIKEGKYAIKWTRLSCSKFRNNEVRLQLHALAYNLGNFMRTLALPKEVEHWSLTTLREKLVKRTLPRRRNSGASASASSAMPNWRSRSKASAASFFRSVARPTRCRSSSSSPTTSPTCRTP